MIAVDNMNKWRPARGIHLFQIPTATRVIWGVSFYCVSQFPVLWCVRLVFRYRRVVLIVVVSHGRNYV